MLFTCVAHIHAFSQQVLGSQKTFGGGDYDEFRKLCLTKDGGYIAGRVIESKTAISIGETIQLGEQYKAGTYIVEVRQGQNMKVLKLVKL